MSKLTTEEKLQLGISLSPIVHTQKRRAPWHDYSEVGVYMITIVTEGRRPLLGRLECEHAPEKPALEARATVAARIALSPLGKAIANEEISKISQFYPQVSVWKICIMPDHLHIILHVSAPLPKGKNLGSIICGFKYGCTVAYRRLYGQQGKTALGEPAPEAQATVAAQAVSPAVNKHIFEHGYNDRILLDDGQLDRWKYYLDDNPRRLAIKRLYPDLFSIRHGRQIGEWTCQMIGNLFLLDIPDKMAIIVHRADTDEVFAQKKVQWMACGERGGVLVSAAISKREKEVINEAKARNYRVIHLQENGFPPLYKPSGFDFDACTSGLLLQISPWEYHNQQQTISRAQCLQLNRLAEEIARM